MTPDKKAPRYMGETPEMVAAFDMYVKMGEKRSIAAVAEQIKRSASTVTNWSKRYDWRLRLQQWQEEAAEQAKDEIKEEFFADRDNLMNYKYELLDVLKKRISKDRYCGACEHAPVSVNEICRAIETIKVELGEPTTIAKGTFKDDTVNPFAGIFTSFFGKPADADAAKAT